MRYRLELALHVSTSMAGTRPATAERSRLQGQSSRRGFISAYGNKSGHDENPIEPPASAVADRKPNVTSPLSLISKSEDTVKIFIRGADATVEVIQPSRRLKNPARIDTDARKR
jgi:hypothetical protein